MVRFRGETMRVAFRPGPNDEIEWWFADLSTEERQALYVSPQEKVAIVRQIRTLTNIKAA